MIGELLALFRAGWRIAGIDALSACWLLELDGRTRRVPVPDAWTLPDTAF